eukprot:sb/3470630/
MSSEILFTMSCITATLSSIVLKLWVNIGYAKIFPHKKNQCHNSKIIFQFCDEKCWALFGPCPGMTARCYKISQHCFTIASTQKTRITGSDLRKYLNYCSTKVSDITMITWHTLTCPETCFYTSLLFQDMGQTKPNTFHHLIFLVRKDLCISTVHPKAKIMHFHFRNCHDMTVAKMKMHCDLLLQFYFHGAHSKDNCKPKKS